MKSSFQDRLKKIQVRIAVKIFSKNQEKSGTFPLKVNVNLVLILPPQIVFDISIWFHFGITLILLSRFVQDMYKFKLIQF